MSRAPLTLQWEEGSLYAWRSGDDEVRHVRYGADMRAVMLELLKTYYPDATIVEVHA